MSVNTKVNGELVKSAGLYKASVPIQSGDIYSFEERQVGVWADGKPLYQKTLVTESSITVTTSGAWVSSGLSAPNGAQVVKGELVNAYLVGIIGVFVNASTGAISFSNIPKTGDITIPTGTELTITYTKTTDVAGSGEYVPSGDKAVHYSTDEQVIGTWINGKTLYGKVVVGTTITGDTTYSVNHNISNIDEIIDHDVNCHFGSNGNWRKLNFTYNSGSTINNAWLGGYSVGATSIDFQCGANFAGGVDKWYAILEYTKTS